MNKFTTISKLRQVGNSTGLILSAEDLDSIDAEQGDEVFIQVRKVPSKQDLLDHMWEKLSEEELAQLSKAAEQEEGSGPTGPNTSAGGTVLCDTGQLLKGKGFVDENPWAALSTSSADITS